jgi:hypothetical protein
MSGDRRVLLERLAVGLAPSDGVLPASDALAAAAAVLDQAGGPALDAQRTIVLVGPPRGCDGGAGRGAGAGPAPTWWWRSAATRTHSRRCRRGCASPIGGQTAPGLVVSALSDRIDAYKRHAHYAFGLCGQAGQAVKLAFQEAEPATVTLPAALPENTPGPCDAQAIAEGHRTFPARLELLFTADQRMAAATAFADPVRRPPFDLSLRVGDGAPIHAMARYRGGPLLLLRPPQLLARARG